MKTKAEHRKRTPSNTNCPRGCGSKMCCVDAQPDRDEDGWDGRTWEYINECLHCGATIHEYDTEKS